MVVYLDKKINNHLQQIQVIVEANMIHLGETSKLELTLASKHSPLCIYNLPLWQANKNKKMAQNLHRDPKLTAGTWKKDGKPLGLCLCEIMFSLVYSVCNCPKRWGSATSTPTWSRATLRYEGWNSSAFSLAREKTHVVFGGGWHGMQYLENHPN